VKRTFPILALALAAGGSLAFHRVRAQDLSAEQPIGQSAAAPNASNQASNLPPLDAAKKQYQEASQRATRVALDFLQQATQQSPGPQANDRQAIRDKLRPLVEQSFDARQRLQQAELNELRARLAEIEQAIAQREQRKDAIVDSRIDELLNPSAERAGAGFVYETVVKDGKEIVIARWVGPGNNPAAAPVPAPAPAGRVPQPGTALSPPPPVDLPPGTELRVREVQEVVVENGERKPVTRRFYETVRTGQSAAPQDNGESSDESLGPPRKSDEHSTGDQAAASADGGFDLRTRERLAQLDLEAAEEDRQAAEQDLALCQQLYEKGATSLTAIREKEKELRQAKRALKRAKAMLEVLALERTELQAAAEADVAEAQTEVEREAAKVRVAEANVDAAMAQRVQLEANVEGATSSLSFQRKVFDRLNQLARVEKAVDMRSVDEKEEKLREAQATLSRAQAAVITGKANVEKAKSAAEEARAAMQVAEARLHAAQARRERLSSPKNSPNQPKPSSAKTRRRRGQVTGGLFASP